MVRNIVAVVVGIVVGMVVNGGLIAISGSIIPLPEGVDPSNMESIKAAMPDFGPQHFVMPFLAHALGALAGALVASLIAKSHNMPIGVGVGSFFIIGGIAMALMLPAPIWFEALDLIVAYVPMGFLGWKLSGKGTGRVQKAEAASS